MAGYSATPLPRKLGIKPGQRIALAGAPDGWPAALGDLPDGARVLARPADEMDVILLFAGRAAGLRRRFDAAAARLAADGGLWVCWPKKASGRVTDIAEPLVRDTGLASGLVDNKICAVDETWSGLRFVVRLADRAQWPRTR